MTERRRTLLSVPVDVHSPAEFLSRIGTALASPGVKTVFAVNPEKIMRARKDPALLRALENSNFLIPDGIGVVLGIRLFYGERVSRTTGIGLMDDLLALAEARGFGVFLFGARPESNRIAAGAILGKYPKLRLSGRRDGYVPAGEYPRLIEEINASGADLLFVALGSPFQEKWIDCFRKELGVKVCMGVGGSLDVMSGAVPAAPRFWRALGLEWLYRLVREPSRARRQMALPAFLFASLRERFLSGDRR